MKMVGTLGSFLGPALIGALADATGGFAAPCLVLGVCLAAGAVLMLAFRAPGTPPRASAQCAQGLLVGILLDPQNCLGLVQAQVHS